MAMGLNLSLQQTRRVLVRTGTLLTAELLGRRRRSSIQANPNRCHIRTIQEPRHKFLGLRQQVVMPHFHPGMTWESRTFPMLAIC